MRSFTPADVSMRGRSFIERHDLVPWITRVMRDDAITVIQGAIDLVDDSVWIYGGFIAIEQRSPFVEPLFPGLCNRFDKG